MDPPAVVRLGHRRARPPAHHAGPPRLNPVSANPGKTRRYSTSLDLVLEVQDTFCPWNAGRYHLRADEDSVTCERTPARPDLRLTSAELGAAYLGGTTLSSLAAGWDAGIRYFDTSPHYGIGHSERRIGELLRGKPRAQYTLSTKVGRLLVPQEPQGRMDEAFAVPATHRRVWDFSRNGIRRSVEDSLTRMGVDRIDVLFLHDAEEHFEAAPQAAMAFPLHHPSVTGIVVGMRSAQEVRPLGHRAVGAVGECAEAGSRAVGKLVCPG
ncbi:aldo/keto reductase [Nonomuraea mesophila]|uniref:aldo/keto reductase n=1 Tax=Nonomuraea mesophila TaxID=2530382 RepID=UPI001FE9736F|nr:aldo/keto reductase [Nonomuraea mesophila]